MLRRNYFSKLPSCRNISSSYIIMRVLIIFFSLGCRRIMEKARQKVKLTQQHKQKSGARTSGENVSKIIPQLT